MVAVFSAVILVVTVVVPDMAYRAPEVVFAPIEDSGFAVKYDIYGSGGIFKGTESSAAPFLKGTFGYDWGAAYGGGKLYLNEYKNTDMSFTTCKVVAVDAVTAEKTVLMEDALLRGRCASGELVCIRGLIMPSFYPDANPFCGLYVMSSFGRLSRDGKSGEIVYLDPESGLAVYTVPCGDVFSKDFASRWLERTLAEVRG